MIYNIDNCKDNNLKKLSQDEKILDANVVMAAIASNLLVCKSMQTWKKIGK